MSHSVILSTSSSLHALQRLIQTDGSGYDDFWRSGLLSGLDLEVMGEYVVPEEEPGVLREWAIE